MEGVSPIQIMKSKESSQMAKPPVIDVSERLRALQAIRSEVAVLREKLFQACCRLQHDDASVDLNELSALTFKLRSIEEKREALEAAVDGLLQARAAE